jgi:hypothetical protein
MGFNKCYLPSIESMKEQIERDGLKEFVRIYRKYDSISGESDRMEFLENKIREYSVMDTPPEPGL